MSHRIVTWGLLLTSVVVLGCARHAGRPPEGKPPRPDKRLEINAELLVEPDLLTLSTGGNITFRIFVSNLSDEPNLLEFESSKQYSLYAYDSGGRQYHLGPFGESPVASTMKLDALETKVFEMRWDGHIWTDGEVVYLPRGKYEIEVRIKGALSNTEFVWLED